MPNAIDKIIAMQSGEDNIEEVTGIPLNNELNKIIDSLPQIPNQEIQEISNNSDIQDIPNISNENTYENILKEIQQDEESMKIAIKAADELSSATKDSLLYYLNLRKPNKNGILFNGVPDALNAAAKLLDLSINGRHKLASMRKLRASIIKDMTSSNKDNNQELNLSLLLED